MDIFVYRERTIYFYNVINIDEFKAYPPTILKRAKQVL